MNLKIISTNFHTSGVRTLKRKKIADEHNLPVYEDTQYIFKSASQVLFELIDAHLSTWKATTLYFRDKSKEREEDGHFKFMTNKFKLHLMTFVADVLAVFKRHQKLIQDDGITTSDVESRTRTAKAQIQSLSTKHLAGG